MWGWPLRSWCAEGNGRKPMENVWRDSQVSSSGGTVRRPWRQPYTLIARHRGWPEDDQMEEKSLSWPQAMRFRQTLRIFQFHILPSCVHSVKTW